MKYLKEFESVARKCDIDIILENYISCMLWIEEERLKEVVDENGEVIDTIDMDIDNDLISDDDKEEMRREIEWFVDLAGDAVNFVTDDMLGSDLWLTRNGHGAGFFDRDIPKNVLDTFEELCVILGYADIYLGDDNKLYYHSSDRYKKIDKEKFKEERKLKKDVGRYNL